MKRINYLVAAALATAVIACNNNKSASNNSDSTSVNAMSSDSASVSDDATDFVTEAAKGGMMEVALGKLAQQNGFSKRVKDFGAMMVKDHSKANAELKQIAASKNISLPDSASAVSDEYSKFQDKKGVEFDKKYMDMMVDDHKKDVKAFEDASNNLSDADLKAFASKTTPILRMHLDSAQAINKDIKGETAPGAVTNGMERQTNP